MSTFGTAMVVDVAPEGDFEQVERVKQVLSAVGHGRAAVAEDNDEYGALWGRRVAQGPTRTNRFALRYRVHGAWPEWVSGRG